MGYVGTPGLARHIASLSPDDHRSLLDNRKCRHLRRGARRRVVAGVEPGRADLPRLPNVGHDHMDDDLVGPDRRKPGDRDVRVTDQAAAHLLYGPGMHRDLAKPG